MRISQSLLRVYNMLMKLIIITIICHITYHQVGICFIISIEKLSRMVRNNFMMHLCTVATLCFFEKTFLEITTSATRTIIPWDYVFKSMYRTLTVATFTSNFIFSMFKSFHTYRNINISNQ